MKSIPFLLHSGEKIANSVSSSGREKLQEDMTTIKDAFEELIDKILSIRSQAEVRLAELVDIDKACVELTATLADIKSILAEENTMAMDFKEKKSRVEKLEDLRNDLEEVECKLLQTENRIMESGYHSIGDDSLLQSSDETIKNLSLSPINNDLNETRELLAEKTHMAEEAKNLHERWIISSDELEEWIQSAKGPFITDLKLKHNIFRFILFDFK